jgi:hypothetical protein
MNFKFRPNRRQLRSHQKRIKINFRLINFYNNTRRRDTNGAEEDFYYFTNSRRERMKRTREVALCGGCKQSTNEGLQLPCAHHFCLTCASSAFRPLSSAPASVLLGTSTSSTSGSGGLVEGIHPPPRHLSFSLFFLFLLFIEHFIFISIQFIIVVQFCCPIIIN